MYPLLFIGREERTIGGVEEKYRKGNTEGEGVEEATIHLLLT